MTREFRILEHTADVGVEATGDSLEQMMSALAEGLAHLVCPADQVTPRQQVTVPAVQAEDLEAVAVDLLSAILAQLQGKRFVTASIEVREAGPLRMQATLSGETYDPARHELGQEIKAVTYHQVRVARQGDVWYGRVFVDI